MISDIPFLDEIELDDSEILCISSHRNNVSGDAEILESNKDTNR